MVAYGSYDVAILGGGPAGGSAAILLAQAGRRVVVLEKDGFPRFHIGESLLPATNPLLRRLGVWDGMLADGCLRKYGAEFLDASGRFHVHNIFARGLLPVDDHTFQVERAHFDARLLRRAEALGATVRVGTVVKSVEMGESTCRVHLGNGEMLQALKVLDATGRDSLLAKQKKIPFDRLPYPKKIAVYSHFQGVERHEGKRGGNITIVRLPGGWFWSIPLDAEKTSVGVVAPLAAFKEAGLEAAAWFARCVGTSPYMRAWMRQAEASAPFHVTGDYTFQRSRFGGDHYFLLGDAASFIDPIFSSGVCLAMGGGAWAADFLARPGNCESAIPAAVQCRYTREWKKRIGTMRRLIEVFYDNAGAAVFLQPNNRLRLFDAVNSVVAGHTRLPLRVAWRFRLFLGLVALNRRTRFLGTIDALPETPAESGVPSVVA